MAVITKHNQRDPSPNFVEAVNEITKIYRSLPPRPTIEEVEAAKLVIESVSSEENAKLEEITKQQRPSDVPEDLFSVLQQVRKNMVLFQSYEQKKEAMQTVEIDKTFQKFDELIQRASSLVSGDIRKEKEVVWGVPVGQSEKLVNRLEGEKFEEGSGSNKGLVRSSSSNAIVLSSDKGEKESIIPIKRKESEPEKLSILKVAAIIETSAKSGEVVLDLQGKLMDQIEWLPVSIGKLSSVAELNLSDNRLMALPSTIGSLKALTKLDIHANQLVNLPDSFTELLNLTDLNLRANNLKSLPANFGCLTNLINLDLSLNSLTNLPESIGNLTRLKTLILETNELNEVPYTIGSCSSLVEMRLDFNQLRALPEAVGKLEFLEILTLHYNRVKSLPTTIGNLSHLKELDVSFNELESIPESLCFSASLEKLNVGKNFADLRSLPRSIGNLENLEELDISDCQISVLPESFRFLAKLRVFRADETPLEMPPRQVAKLGAQAVVQYMDNLVAQRNAKPQSSKNRKKKSGFWFWFCSFCKAQQSSASQKNPAVAVKT
ncbi:Leucine-rich repeat [Dillenia turbinata]|uniref:Leucine-rich repeat n=1 Tax=Dillenia turbinata TaxID=194707 RepID=A0AAN8WGB0_9MAGN